MVSAKRAYGARAMACASVLAIVAFGQSQALAQPSETKSADVEKVTVTAMKREGTVQSTAASITALAGEDMEDRGIRNVQDLQFQVPGLVYGETSGSPQIGIRGIGLSVETGFAEQGVASHIDGVFLPRPGMTNLPLGDLERVEVLRGPQGTLYGRNATGGVIDYITNKPTKKFEAGFTAGMAEFGTYRGEAFVSGPIGENLLGRLYVDVSETDGFLENLPGPHIGDEERQGGRASVRFLPGDDVTVDLEGLYVRRTGSYIYNQATHGFGPLYALEPPIRANSVQSEDQNDAEQEVTGGIATVSADFSGLLFKSVTSVLREERDEFYDSDGGYFGGLQLTDIDRYDVSKSYSQEFNLNGTAFGDRLTWVAGAYYFSEDADLNIDVAFGPSLGGARLDQNLTEQNTTYGVFADLTYSLAEDLRLVGGLRYGRDEKELSWTYNNPLTATACAVKNKVAFDSLNPKVAVEYDAADDVLLYAQYTEGTKPGGGNPSLCNSLFKDEKVRATEVGVKSKMLDGILTANASAFYYDYTDYQVFQINASLSADVINAPRAHVAGAEFEFQLSPGDGFLANLGIAYLNAEYDEFTQSDGFAAIQLMGLAPFLTETIPLTPQDLEGKKLSRAPDWTINLGAEKTWLLPDNGLFGSFTVRGDVYWVDDMYFRQFNMDFDRQEAHAVGNIVATLMSADEKWKLRGFVKNVGDTEYIVSQFGNPSPLGNAGMVGVYGAPRTFGIELAARFGAD